MIRLPRRSPLWFPPPGQRRRSEGGTYGDSKLVAKREFCFILSPGFTSSALRGMRGKSDGARLHVRGLRVCGLPSSMRTTHDAGEVYLSMSRHPWACRFVHSFNPCTDKLSGLRLLVTFLRPFGRFLVESF